MQIDQINDQLIMEFLRESNAIEGVFDDDSLDQARYAWDYLMGEEVLTTGVVLKTHKILMLHQKLQPNHKGYWRDCQVWVGGREGANYKMVPMLMQQWCFESMNWTRIKRCDLPLLTIYADERHTYYQWFK